MPINYENLNPALPPKPLPGPAPASDPSIVNFLTSLGLPSDPASRAKLAAERGITGYVRTGPQNTRLLEMLRKEHEAGTFGQKPEIKPPAREESLKLPSKEGERPNQDIQAEIIKLNEEENKKTQEEAALIEEKTNGKVDLSTSVGLIKRLTGFLEEKTKEEAKPQIQEEKFIAEREKLGITGLETDLAKIDANLKKLDADFTSTIQEEEGRQVSMTQIRRRQGAAELAYNRARRDLIIERDSIANQLNMKYGVVNSIMKYAGADYDNARQDYQDKWNKAIQMTNLMKGIEESAKTDQERKTDNARANLQIMENLFKGGNVDYNDLDASTQLDIKNMEMQSGFPVGLTKFVAKNIKQPTAYKNNRTDDAGNEWVDVVPFGDDGKADLANIQHIFLGKGKKPAETAEQKALAYDQIKTKAVKLFSDGATIDEYNQIKNELIQSDLGSYLDNFDTIAKNYLDLSTQEKVGIPKAKEPEISATIIGKINQLKEANASLEDIKYFVEVQSGYNFNNSKIQETLKNYIPIKPKSWWQIWK